MEREGCSAPLRRRAVALFRTMASSLSHSRTQPTPQSPGSTEYVSTSNPTLQLRRHLSHHGWGGRGYPVPWTLELFSFCEHLCSSGQHCGCSTGTVLLPQLVCLKCPQARPAAMRASLSHHISVRKKEIKRSPPAFDTEDPNSPYHHDRYPQPWPLRAPALVANADFS